MSLFVAVSVNTQHSALVSGPISLKCNELGVGMPECKLQSLRSIVEPFTVTGTDKYSGRTAAGHRNGTWDPPSSGVPALHFAVKLPQVLIPIPSSCDPSPLTHKPRGRRGC